MKLSSIKKPKSLLGVLTPACKPSPEGAPQIQGHPGLHGELIIPTLTYWALSQNNNNGQNLYLKWGFVSQNNNVNFFYFRLQNKNKAKDNLRMQKQTPISTHQTRHRVRVMEGVHTRPAGPPTCALRRDAAVRRRSITGSLRGFPSLFFTLQLNTKGRF